MSKIQTFLQNILSARYGKDVRQSIHDAIQEIDKVADTAQGSATEAAEIAVNSATAAEQYRNETKQYRDEAALFTPDNYTELVDQVNTNTIKIDTVIEKADLGIKETASGEEIHVTDSADSKTVEFALFGKAKQNTTSGKNLIRFPYYYDSRTINGVTFTVNSDGSVTANGTATASASFILKVRNEGIYEFEPNSYVLSGCPSGGSKNKYLIGLNGTVDGNSQQIGTDIGNGVEVKIQDNTPYSIYIYIESGYKAENLLFKPMIRLASITDNTWEPYTGGQSSPSPEFLQDVEVSGESYNLLENTATSQTMNGVSFTVNEDKSVAVNGTNNGTAVSQLILNSNLILPYGSYKRVPHSNNVKFLIQVRNRESGAHVKTLTTLEETFSNLDWDYELYTYRVILEVAKNVTVDNEIIYPMIREASVKNDRYMPYGVGSVEVKSSGKNLLKNTATSKEVNGVTFTVNRDGTIVANGISSSNYSGLKLIEKCVIEGNFNKSSKYLFSACPEQQGETNYRGVITFYDNNGEAISDVVEYGLEKEIIFPTEAIKFTCRIDVLNKYEVKNILFKPMIRLATDTDEYEPYKETTSTIPTDGLAGIPVSSGGNYTDSNGQQWICDEIVKYADGSGEYVQRVGKVVFDGSSDKVWIYSEAGGAIRFLSVKIRDLVSKPLSASNKGNLICNLFKITTANNTYLGREEGIAVELNGNLSVYYSKWTSTNDIIKSLANNNMIVYYELAEPIRTPLTAEEIAEIEKLHTFYPVTNISNDFDCGMRVKYLADSKNYIDNQLALQAQAREQEMMAMFMLLPEETQAAMIENDINNLLTESEDK